MNDNVDDAAALRTRVAALEKRLAETSETLMNLYFAVAWMRIKDEAVDYLVEDEDKAALDQANAGIEAGLSECRRLIIVDGPNVVR